MNKIVCFIHFCLAIVTSVQAGSQQVYQNSAYGFQLTLPGTWKSYKVVEILTSWPGQVKAPTLYVCLKTNDKNWSNGPGFPQGYAPLIAIAVYTSAQLEKINQALKLGEDPTMNEIVPGKSTKKIHFTYTGPQAAPHDLNERVGEIGEILKTFKIAP